MDLNLLISVLEKLDTIIGEANLQRREDGGAALGRVQIQVLGQLGLMIHPDFPSDRITLLGTVDVDAKISADWFVKDQLSLLLQKQGLELDIYSDLIWIPKESTFTQIFDGIYVKCEVLDPIFSLVSKAIKAKEKKRFLVRDALKEFGKPLEDLIKKYEGDIKFFKETK